MRSISLYITALLVAVPGTLLADTPRKKDVSKYIKQLQTAGNAKARADAADWLGHRGEIKKADVVDAIEPLVTALKTDRAANVRKSAASAIAAIGPEPQTAVPALIEALKDKSIDVQIAAANALGTFGRDAAEAMSVLRQVKTEAEKGFTKKGKKTPAERKKQQLARAAGMALRSIAGKLKQK
jgi:hypothetical protein